VSDSSQHLSDDHRDAIASIVAAALKKAPTPKGVKSAFVVHGVTISGLILAMWSWADNVSAKIAKHDKELEAVPTVIHSVNVMEAERLANDVKQSESARRLARVEDKIDQIMDRLPPRGSK